MADKRPEQSRKPQRGTWGDMAFVAITLGIIAVYAESQAAARQPCQHGLPEGYWTQALSGLALYSGAVLAVSAIAALLLGRIVRCRSLGLLSSGVAAMVCAVLLFAGSPLLPTAVAIAIGVPAAALIASGLGIIGARSFLVSIASGVAMGLAARHSSAELFFPARNWQSTVTAVGFSWVCLGAVAALAVNRALRPAHDDHWARAAAVAVLVGSVLPLALTLTPVVRNVLRKPGEKSIVLVTADALRADWCSVYGGDVSVPNMEALAKRGVVYDNYHTSSPWTVPSISTLFSGKVAPGLTPGLERDDHLKEETSYFRLASYWLGQTGQLLPSTLRDKGYATAAFVGNPAIARDRWLHREFSDIVFVDSLWAEVPVRLRHLPLLRNRLAAFWPSLAETCKIDSTEVLTRYTTAFLRLHRNEDIFLWTHFMDPHSPYNPPARYRTSTGRWSQFEPSRKEQDADPEWRADLTDEDKAYAKSLYRGEIRYVDEALGRIMDVFESCRAAKSTYFVFSSDHGEEFWDHGRWGHGFALHEEHLRVPLIVTGPGILAKRVTAPVSAVDFMPALARLVGLSPWPDWDGGPTLYDALYGDVTSGKEPPPSFAQATACMNYNPEPQQSMRSGKYKFIRGLESGTEELYDLDKDPGEQTDVVDSLPEVTEKLRAQLDAWSQTVPVTFDQAGTAGALQPPDDETLQRMKDIGYLSD